ncbi:MAG: DUF4389 domain-containing protein [Spirochaetes bacterium]|nr:DUF4389 domain-containing protein [Spirochaetota bacterium]
MSNPVKLSIEYPEQSSRGLLLLRLFFGFFYVIIPHGICLMVLGLVAMFAMVIAWVTVLFTGKYPKGLFDFIVGVSRWSTRVGTYMVFLTDKYPAFGMSEKVDDTVKFNVEYPQSLSRGKLLVKTFFGIFYVMIPHGFCLYIRMLITYIFLFIAFWVVLFTGQFPKGMHDFVVGTFRWQARVNMYFIQTDVYPPFSGKE